MGEMGLKIKALVLIVSRIKLTRQVVGVRDPSGLKFLLPADVDDDLRPIGQGPLNVLEVDLVLAGQHLDRFDVVKGACTGQWN